jgi:probable rRNA maturation factor
MHIAGDIVISIDTVMRNADALGIDKRIELKRLLIHSFLHLYGMDHENNDDTMIDFQERLLQELAGESV